MERNNDIKVINPLKQQTDKSGFFEQQVYGEEGLSRAVKSDCGSGNIPKIILKDNIMQVFSEKKENSLEELANKDVSIESKMEEKRKVQLPPELQGKKFRIRKLTPRECGRLMDVDDADIDKIEATGLSNSAMYRLYGNSIVVNVLYHIFRKAFIETDPDIVKGKPQQLTLF